MPATSAAARRGGYEPAVCAETSVSENASIGSLGSIFISTSETSETSEAAKDATSASPRNASRRSPSAADICIPSDPCAEFFEFALAPCFASADAAPRAARSLSVTLRSPFSTARPTPSANLSAASTAASTAPETALATADCAAASIFSVFEGAFFLSETKRFSFAPTRRGGASAPPPPREDDAPTRLTVEARFE